MRLKFILKRDNFKESQVSWCISGIPTVSSFEVWINLSKTQSAKVEKTKPNKWEHAPACGGGFLSASQKHRQQRTSYWRERQRTEPGGMRGPSGEKWRVLLSDH